MGPSPGASLTYWCVARQRPNICLILSSPADSRGSSTRRLASIARARQGGTDTLAASINFLFPQPSSKSNPEHPSVAPPGLVKVVFATETLAAGINMPARTTIISSLSRRRDGGIVLLQHNELLQMAGGRGWAGTAVVNMAWVELIFVSAGRPC